MLRSIGDLSPCLRAAVRLVDDDPRQPAVLGGLIQRCHEHLRLHHLLDTGGVVDSNSSASVTAHGWMRWWTIKTRALLLLSGSWGREAERVKLAALDPGTPGHSLLVQSATHRIVILTLGLPWLLALKLLLLLSELGTLIVVFVLWILFSVLDTGKSLNREFRSKHTDRSRPLRHRTNRPGRPTNVRQTLRLTDQPTKNRNASTNEWTKQA